MPLTGRILPQEYAQLRLIPEFPDHSVGDVMVKNESSEYDFKPVGREGKCRDDGTADDT